MCVLLKDDCSECQWLAAMWSTDTTQFRVFISVLMVTTGSINTLAVK